MARASSETARQRSVNSERRDVEFIRERKNRESANLEKTLRLRALRLEKEATAKATALTEKAAGSPVKSKRK